MDCTPIFAIVMNMWVQKPLQDLDFSAFAYSPRSGIMIALNRMVVLFSLFFEDPPACFPQWLHHCISPPTGHGGSRFSAASPTLTIFWFLISAVLPGVRRSLTGVLMQISLGSGDTDHLFIYLLAICLSSLWPILKIKLFLLLSCRTPYCLPEVLFCLSQSKCPRVCISMQQELGESVTRCAPLGI